MATAFPIVVGFDGSSNAHTALRWALDEAARHTAVVRLVHALESQLSSPPLPMLGARRDRGERLRAQSMITEQRPRRRTPIPPSRSPARC